MRAEEAFLERDRSIPRPCTGEPWWPRGGGGLGCVPGAPCGGAEYYDQNVPAKVATAQRFTAIGLGWQRGS